MKKEKCKRRHWCKRMAYSFVFKRILPNHC